MYVNASINALTCVTFFDNFHFLLKIREIPVRLANASTHSPVRADFKDHYFNALNQYNTIRINFLCPASLVKLNFELFFSKNLWRSVNDSDNRIEKSTDSEYIKSAC